METSTVDEIFPSPDMGQLAQGMQLLREARRLRVGDLVSVAHQSDGGEHLYGPYCVTGARDRVLTVSGMNFVHDEIERLIVHERVGR